MNNIKKIYQHADKCDYQQILNDILEAALLSTPEGFTDISPNVHMPSTPVKKPISRKSLCLFTIRLDVLKKQQNIVLELQNPYADPLKLVKGRSDFLALGFLTGVDVVGALGLLSMTNSGVETI